MNFEDQHSKLKAPALRRLALILLLYLVLATIYSLVTPIGRGADEWAHYWYAQFIAQHGRLPANPAEREVAGYKSDWPPLYHLFVAGLTAWIETDGPPTFKYRQDNNRRQLIPPHGSEPILHTEDEHFPWRQEILVWHLGRFLSILFSLATLLVTYLLALEIFTSLTPTPQSPNLPISHLPSPSSIPHPIRQAQGKPPSSILHPPSLLALTAVALLAFNPRFLFTGMLFNYDSLTLLLASLFLWLVIRIVNGHHSQWGFPSLGILAGLALVTKYLAAPLITIILVVALLLEARENSLSVIHHGGAVQDGERRSPLSFLKQLIIHHSSFIIHLPPRRFVMRLAQAALPFLLIISGWFGYLLFNFNEIETYGPLLGTLAPLLRGDGSDRTVEEIFAFLSGGQTPAPAHIDKPDRTAWQIISELPLTFWGNPISRPYPLTWFVIVMLMITGLALAGLIIAWRSSTLTKTSNLPIPNLQSPIPQERFAVSNLQSPTSKELLTLLALPCLLPLPFMLIRLFGARDPLEAVQGRHILFLAGPAIATLTVWGLSEVTLHTTYYALRTMHYALRITHYTLRITFHILLALLLTSAISQLIFMAQTYPPPLPVCTDPYPTIQVNTLVQPISLEGGARLLGYTISEHTRPAAALQVTLIWQGGHTPAPEDYQMELALVDEQGQSQAGWRAYQTQARYPSRAWEEGDIIRDEGWLPLVGLSAGDYEVRLQILGQIGPIGDWLTLTGYTLKEDTTQLASETGWVLWQQGKIAHSPPLLHERETAQFTFISQANQQPGQPLNGAGISASPSPAASILPYSLLPTPYSLTSYFGSVSASPSPAVPPLQLIGPDGAPRLPVSIGPAWANFIIGPDWPAGDYYPASHGDTPLFRLDQSQRNFQIPEIAYPLAVDFEGKIKLLGYDLPSPRAEPGGGLPITLYWQALNWMGEEFVIFNRLLDNQQTAHGGYDRLAQENYSTLRWAPGEVVIDGFAVPVAPDASPGVYTLTLGWYRQMDGQAVSLAILDPETGQATTATAVTIGPIKVGGPPAGLTVEQARPQTKVDLVLGEQIKLLGFDLLPVNNAEPEQTSSCSSILSPDLACSLRLALYWETIATPARDYTVFVHLHNAAGEIVAQRDRPPLDGAYPSSLWDIGEIIKDEMTIPLQPLEPGRYELVVGMYDFQTGARLTVSSSPDNTILLQLFEVRPQ